MHFRCNHVFWCPLIYYHYSYHFSLQNRKPTHGPIFCFFFLFQRLRQCPNSTFWVDKTDGCDTLSVATSSSDLPFPCPLLILFPTERSNPSHGPICYFLNCFQRLRQCPKCKFWVEKTDGCDAMHCRCNLVFCYQCGGCLQAKPGLKKCECEGVAELLRYHEQQGVPNHNLLARPQVYKICINTYIDLDR